VDAESSLTSEVWNLTLPRSPYHAASQTAVSSEYRPRSRTSRVRECASASPEFVTSLATGRTVIQTCRATALS
jgi:hypothetical protein